MNNFINGYGKPVFKIYSSEGELIETIVLPECNSEGEPESYRREGTTVHTLLNGRIVTMPHAGADKTYRITWKLNYNRHITGSDCLKVMKIINYSDSGTCRVTLIPYNDMPTRSYDVYFSGDEFTLEIKKGGKYANGMYLTALEFSTVELHPIKWILASEPAAGYGGEHSVPFTGEQMQ